MKNKNKAFSLIELSIVILIIGILIAGVTSGSRLVNASKLQTAQTVTQSAPVTSIKGLVLWLETSMEDSFVTGENVDATNISRWNDRNTQAVYKYYARPASSSSAIQFKYSDTAGINSLPSLYFDGSSSANGFLTLSTASGSAVASPISTPNNNFTYFVVAKAASTDISAANRTVFYNGLVGTDGYGYTIGDNAGSSNYSTRNMIFGDGSAAENNFAGTITTGAEVVSATSAGGTGGAIFTYVNGTSVGTDTTSTSAAPTTGFYVGAKNSTGGNLWKGYISEIILFDSVLKSSDRKAVEKYLGKKYAITVAE